MTNDESPNHQITESPNSNHPITESPNLFAAGMWLLALAALLLTCGACSGAFYLVVPFVIKNQPSAIEVNIFLGAFAALGILFGALFAWQGIRAVRHRASDVVARAFPPALVWLLAFLLALGLGMGALALASFAALTFPPFHFLAAVLPSFALLAYAARALNVTSGMRALVAALGWGALGSTLLALSLEAMIGVIMLAGVGIALALTPDGVSQLDRLSVELRALRALDEQTLMRFVFANPGIIVLMLVYFAGIVPLIEEAVKTLILAFVDPQRTCARDLVLWGLAAGVGFAMVESALNASIALEMWVVVMLARVGATVMHAANGVVMGQGWYAARIERRWSRLGVAYVVSVGLHSLWNVLVVGQAVSAVGFFGSTRPLRVESWWLWLTLAAALGLFTLTFGGMGWIVYAVRRVREPTEQKFS
jgi:hypothetical protein